MLAYTSLEDKKGLRYTGITLSVRLYIFLSSATPSYYSINRYLYNFTQFQYTTWECA